MTLNRLYLLWEAEKLHYLQIILFYYRNSKIEDGKNWVRYQRDSRFSSLEINMPSLIILKKYFGPANVKE